MADKHVFDQLAVSNKQSYCTCTMIACTRRKSLGTRLYIYSGFESHLRQLIFLRKSDCLGCAVLLCLVCLFDLACFFLPSHLSLKHVYTAHVQYMWFTDRVYTRGVHVRCNLHVYMYVNIVYLYESPAVLGAPRGHAKEST